MMNVAERKQSTAAADAQRWLESFETALSAQDAAAAADLFIADGLWRDVLAFTWTIQTMAGRAAIKSTLRETLARAQPANFHVPAKRTPPRWVTRAGRQTIETAVRLRDRIRPANGVIRLVPDAQGSPARMDVEYQLDELTGHEDEFKRAARRNRPATSAPRTGATA